jgi:hypothetical protein
MWMVIEWLLLLRHRYHKQKGMVVVRGTLKVKWEVAWYLQAHISVSTLSMGKR